MEVVKLTDTIKDLNSKLELEKAKLENISLYDILLREKLKIKDEFKWINTNQWDSVVITPIDSEEKYVFVNNEDILKDLNDFFYITREVVMPPSGFRPDIQRYLYTFISGDKQYDVAIVERGIVEIDGHYYETNPYIHKLGDAYIKGSSWSKAGNIETKIADAGLIMTTFGPIYSDWRIHMLADVISKGNLINEKTSLSKEEGVNYIAYYYGEEILIKVYTDYICINDGSKEYWYELEDADFKAHHILNGMG